MSISIGLLGFGKTGSLVAQELVKDSEIQLKWVGRRVIQPNLKFASHALGHYEGFAPFVAASEIDENFIKSNPVDLIIDFSVGASSKLYQMFANQGVKIVSAISKYSDAELLNLSKASASSAILSSPNITLGINWLLVASKLLKQMIPHADVEIVEEHFRDKKEISGTAIKIAEHLNLENNKHINSIRVGGIVGKHEVIFGLPFQTIRLTHESISLSAFGTGAIVAAKWLVHKDNGLYRMESMFYEKFIQHINTLVTQ